MTKSIDLYDQYHAAWAQIRTPITIRFILLEILVLSLNYQPLLISLTLFVGFAIYLFAKDKKLKRQFPFETLDTAEKEAAKD